MLSEIRDRSSGWFAWIIAALIIIPMAFWGVQEYASTEAVPTLIEVGDQTITENQFQAQLVNEQQRQRQAMGDQVNNALLNSEYFKQNVLQQMVNRALIDQIAEDQNYQIGNDQLSEYIKQNPIFQVDGKFDVSAYERYVVSSQYSKTQFENAIRNDSRIGQVMSGFQESSFVLPDELRLLLELQAEQRSFDLLTINKQNYMESVEVSDDEVAEFYASNEQNFMEGEKVSLSYVELDVNQIMLDIDVNEDELLDIYEQNIDSYISDETREARHILLSTNGDNDDDQRAKAETLVAELRAGADFAELAQQNSEDPGSASVGGDLGEIERGVMVAEFEDATFSLEEGAISDPIKTQFGYHIIQVSKINASEQQSFADVRFDIEQVEKQRLAEEELLYRVDELGDLAFEQPENLDFAAQEMSLDVLTTDLFEQSNGTGIAANEEVRNIAFSEPILFDNTNSAPIEIATGHYVVIRKLDHQPSRPKELALVSDQIKEILVDQKASAAASAEGAQLLEEAQQDWATLVSTVEASETLELESYTVSLSDQERQVDNAVLTEVANMQLLDGAPVTASVTSSTGDYYIVRLNSVSEGDVSTVSQQIIDNTRQLIQQRNGDSLASAYIESLREQLVPEIDSSLL